MIRQSTIMKKSEGFSLIELLLVVAIIGILSAVAVNIYSDQVIASNRTEARSALQTAAGTLEKCKSLYGSYDIGVGTNCNYADFQTASGLYDITAVMNATNTTFTLTAAPAPGSRQVADLDCLTLTLDNLGLQAATGGDPTVCW